MDNNQNLNNASISNDNTIINPLANNMPASNNVNPINNGPVVQPQPAPMPSNSPQPLTVGPVPNPSTNVANNNPAINSAPLNNNVNQVDNGATAVPQSTPMPNPNVQPQPVVNQQPENSSETNSYLNDMNVNGAYNHMDAPPEYVNDQQITNNVQLATGQKKVTVPVSKELKTVVIIALILLAFIIVLPMLGDLLTNLKFR